MSVKVFDFNYNVALKTINCINAIDFTYHINNYDYPQLHTHSDYFEFTILSSGSVENIRNGKKEIIGKDTLFISNEKDTHLIKQIGKEDIVLLNIIVRSVALKRIVDLLFPGFFETLDSGKKVYSLPKYITYMLYKNIEIVNTIDSEDWEKRNEILKSIIISIISHLYINDIKKDSSLEKWESLLNGLKNEEEFYTYNVNQLCERLGYSRVQLNRIFATKYNTTPHKYLLDAKMDYAASLLSYTDYTVLDICKLIGYTSQIQFNENFKAKYGITPYAYKLKNAKSKVN